MLNICNHWFAPLLCFPSDCHRLTVHRRGVAPVCWRASCLRSNAVECTQQCGQHDFVGAHRCAAGSWTTRTRSHEMLTKLTFSARCFLELQRGEGWRQRYRPEWIVILATVGRRRESKNLRQNSFFPRFYRFFLFETVTLRSVIMFSDGMI